MKREDATILELNGFIMNAGIVGFVKMLEHLNAEKGMDYEIKGHELWISNQLLKETDWAQVYIDTTIETFYADSAYPQILNVIETIGSLTTKAKSEGKVSKELKEQLTKQYGSLLSSTGYFSSGSFKSGYVIIKDETGIDLEALLKEIKGTKDWQNKYTLLLKLVDVMSHSYVKEVLCLKSIAYRYLNKFWSNKAFLTRDTKTNMKSLLEKDFTETLTTFSEKQETLDYAKMAEEGAKQCLECDRFITNKSPNSLSLLNDMADDIKRKASAFWNFDASNLFLCDICAFTYILAPLGFVRMGDRMVFVNACSDIENLLLNNSQENLEDDSEFNWIQLHRQLIARMVQKHRVQVDNIQLITRTLDQERARYNFTVLDRQTLAFIALVETELNHLAKGYPVRISKKESLDVYNEVLQNVLQHRTQEFLFIKMLRLATDESLKGALAFKLQMLFRIILKKQQLVCKQVRLRGGFSVSEQELYELTQQATSNGVQTRYAMKEAGRTSQLSSIIYRLINAIQTNNKEVFFTTVLQLNNSTNRKLSPAFIRALVDAEYFKIMGMAFVMGLQGTAYSMSRKAEAMNQEEVITKTEEE